MLFRQGVFFLCALSQFTRLWFAMFSRRINCIISECRMIESVKTLLKNKSELSQHSFDMKLVWPAFLFSVQYNFQALVDIVVCNAKKLLVWSVFKRTKYLVFLVLKGKKPSICLFLGLKKTSVSVPISKTKRSLLCLVKKRSKWGGGEGGYDWFLRFGIFRFKALEIVGILGLKT